MANWQVARLRAAPPVGSNWQVSALSGTATPYNHRWEIGELRAVTTLPLYLWLLGELSGVSTPPSDLSVSLGAARTVDDGDLVTINAVVSGSAGQLTGQWVVIDPEPDIQVEIDGARLSFIAPARLSDSLRLISYTAQDATTTTVTAQVQVTVRAVTERAVVGGAEVPLSL